MKVIVEAHKLQLILIIQIPLPWDLRWFHLIVGPIDLRRQDIQVKLRQREGKENIQFMIVKLAMTMIWFVSKHSSDINHAMSEY